MEKPNVVKELGIFAKCQNEWCLQKGLQKPQHTKCVSVTNNGTTCNNPLIKYGASTVGLPKEYSKNVHYGKWCGQLGGLYFDHTVGSGTGYAVILCKGYDDPENWHWCSLYAGYWYNQSLDFHETSNNFITSITCNKITTNCEDLNKLVEEPSNRLKKEQNYIKAEQINILKEPNNVAEESNQGALSTYFELILKAQIKLFGRPVIPNIVVEEQNSTVDEPNNVMEEQNNVMEEPRYYNGFSMYRKPPTVKF